MIHRTILIAALLAILVPATTLAQDADTRLPSIDLPQDLDRVLRDYERDWQAGDESGLAGLFTADGVIRSDEGWIRGPDAIRERYASAGGDLRLRAVAFSTSATAGYIVGAYGYGDGASERDRGVFVLALRRESPDDPWLIAADLDHTVD